MNTLEPEELRSLIEKHTDKHDQRWADTIAPSLAAKLMAAIEARDLEKLLYIRNPENHFSRELFTAITGLQLARRQSDTEATIKAFVGEEVVAQYEQQQAQAMSERQRLAQQLELKEAIASLMRQQVKYRGNVMSNRVFIDTIISEGFTQFEEVKLGAAPTYQLSNSQGTCFNFRRKVEKIYILHALSQQSSQSANAAVTLSSQAS